MDRHVSHIRKSDGARQSSYDHSMNAARIAERFLDSVRLGKAGYFSTLIHDMGKFKKDFDEYILKAAAGDRVVRGSVNHTFAAVRYLMEHYHVVEGSDDWVAAEVIACAAGMHHGLFDCFGAERNGEKSGLRYRCSVEVGYDEAVNDFFQEFGFSAEDMDHMFCEARDEIISVLKRLYVLAERGQAHDIGLTVSQEYMFYCSLLVRLLASAVIEGDREDTASFMTGVQYLDDMSDDMLQKMWDEALQYLEEKLKDMPCDTPVNKIRREISDTVRQLAGSAPGVFRLKVDVGGGKTLSVLRWLLAHSKIWSMRRVFVTEPQITILDQVVGVVTDNTGGILRILEHHSNVVDDGGSSPEERQARDLSVETWDVPVIATTSVQFLNTLFGGRTQSIRRMHSLIRSVIIIDEVQMIPKHTYSMFYLALNFLVEVCGCSVVLCSATQPCLDGLIHRLSFDVTDLCPASLGSADAFRRMEICYEGRMSLSEIGDFTAGRLEEADSVLLVTNTTKQAKMLCRQLKGKADMVLHLSARMCQAHRREVLSGLMNALDRSRSCPEGKRYTVICVATRVVEAGVDISFGSVVRFFCGLDSLIQTGGRGNRNGELGVGVMGVLHLVDCIDEDSRQLPLDMRSEQEAMQYVLHMFQKDPGQYDNRLDSGKAVDSYYKKLFALCSKETFDGKVRLDGQEETIFNLLSLNTNHCGVKDLKGQHLRQGFRMAGYAFSPIEDSSMAVITEYGGGREIIEKLMSHAALSNSGYARKLLMEAKPYMVSLFKSDRDKLGSHIVTLPCGAMVLYGHYDKDSGVDLDKAESLKSFVNNSTA